MFIVTLEYKAPLEEIDSHLQAHRTFLDRHFATGAFLASGPKQPRTGGVILAGMTSREELESILQQDPFFQLDLADYRVEAFAPTRFCDVLPETLRHWLTAEGSI